MEKLGRLNQQETLWLVTIVFLGAVLRMWGLSTHSLWLDEVTSLEIASKSLSGILGGEKFDHHTPPFYYVVLHFWLKLTSQSEFGLRSLSAALDCLNILLLFLCARYHLASSRAFIATALYACSSFSIYYAQEGRMYTLLVLFVLATYCYTIQLRENRFSWSSFIGLCFVGIAGMYTHYYYALAIAGMSLMLLAHTKRDSIQITKWLGACFLIGLAFIPWIKVVLGLMGSGGQSFREYFYSVIPYTLFRFGAGYAIFPFNLGTKDDFTSSALDNWPSLGAYLIIFGLAFLLGAHRTFVKGEKKEQNLLGVLLFPLIAAFLISFKLPMLSERYLIVSYPFFLIVLSRVFLHEHSKNLLGLAVFCLSVGATTLYYLNPNFGKTQWREIASEIQSHNEALPIYVAPEYGQPTLDFYAQNLGLRTPIRFPEELSTSSALSHANLPVDFLLVVRGHTDSYKTELNKLGYGSQVLRKLPLENGLSLIRMTLLHEEKLPF